MRWASATLAAAVVLSRTTFALWRRSSAKSEAECQLALRSMAPGVMASKCTLSHGWEPGLRESSGKTCSQPLEGPTVPACPNQTAGASPRWQFHSQKQMLLLRVVYPMWRQNLSLFIGTWLPCPAEGRDIWWSDWGAEEIKFQVKHIWLDEWPSKCRGGTGCQAYEVLNSMIIYVRVNKRHQYCMNNWPVFWVIDQFALLPEAL